MLSRVPLEDRLAERRQREPSRKSLARHPSDLSLDLRYLQRPYSSFVTIELLELVGEGGEPERLPLAIGVTDGRFGDPYAAAVCRPMSLSMMKRKA